MLTMSTLSRSREDFSAGTEKFQLWKSRENLKETKIFVGLRERVFEVRANSAEHADFLSTNCPNYTDYFF